MFPRWSKILGAFMVLLIAGGIAFAVFEPIQVLPRIRLAPGYSLTTASGTNLTSETVRGSVTLYTFATVECGEECLAIEDTMRTVERRAALEIDLEAPFRLVTLVLDPQATDDDLRQIAERSGADGDSWTVVRGDLTELQTIVGAGFNRYYEVSDDGGVRFDPGYVLVDGTGVIRGDYRYQTLADDADKLIRHTEILAAELRHADGPSAVAYEAAHLFLCYP